jgi:hypothetical protein
VRREALFQRAIALLITAAMLSTVLLSNFSFNLSDSAAATQGTPPGITTWTQSTLADFDNGTYSNTINDSIGDGVVRLQTETGKGAPAIPYTEYLVSGPIITWFWEDSSAPVYYTYPERGMWLTGYLSDITYSWDGSQYPLYDPDSVPLMKKDGAMRYDAVAPGISELYTKAEGGIKHDYIISDRLPGLQDVTANTLDFVSVLELASGLKPYVDGKAMADDFETSSRIELRDEYNKIIFLLPEPVAYEQNDLDNDVRLIYDWKYNYDNVILTLKVPANWLKDKERGYPVVVDPTVVASTGGAFPTSENNNRKIARDANENLYAVYIKDVSTIFQVFVARSQDNGKTWYEIQATNSVTSCNDPGIAMDSENNIHIVFTNNSHIWYNQYDGYSWGGAMRISAGAGGVYPSLAIDRDNNIFALWERNDGSYLQIYYNRFNDATGSWQGENVISTGSYHSYFPSIAIDNNNTPHLVWYRNTASGMQIHYSKYVAGTWTGQIQITSTLTNWHPSIATTSDGNLHVVMDRSTTPTHIYYMEFNTTTQTWSGEIPLSTSGNTHQYPSVTVDADDNVYAFWHDNTFTISYRSRIKGSWGSVQIAAVGSSYKYPNTRFACFNSPKLGLSSQIDFIYSDGTSPWYNVTYDSINLTIIDDDADGSDTTADNNQRKIARDNFGNIYVTYQRLETFYRVIVARSSNDGATWEELPMPKDSGSHQFNPTIAVDSKGHVHLAWREFEGSNYDIYHAVWNGTGWSWEQVYDSNYNSVLPAIAIDLWDTPHIVWEESTPVQNILYTRRDEWGEWEDPTNISQSTTADYRPSITTDYNGYVHIIWHSQRGGALYRIWYKMFDYQWNVVQQISDGGAVWDANYASVAIGPDNILRATFQRYDSGTSRNQIWYLDNAGGGWNPEVQITSVVANHDKPSITVDGSGQPFVFYHIDAVDDIYYSWYDNNGAAWSGEVPFYKTGFCEFVGTRNGIHEPLMGKNSKLDFVWTEGSGAPYNIRYGSVEGVAAKATDVSSINAAQYTSERKIVRDSEGNIYVIISRIYLGVNNIFISKSTDDGKTWSLSPPGSYCSLANSVYAAIAIDSSDIIHAVWVNQTSTATYKQRIFYNLYDTDNDLWAYAGGINITRGLLAKGDGHSQNPSLVIDSADTLTCVWQNSTIPYDLWYSRNSGGGWTMEQEIASTAGNTYNPCLAVDSNDNVYVVWRETDTYFSMFNGATWSAPALIINTVNPAMYPNIVKYNLSDMVYQVHEWWKHMVEPNAS